MLNSRLNLNNLNPQRYPDSDAKELRENMAEYYGCKMENILVGNGSSDLLLTTINAFCKNKEKVMTFDPSFSMYGIYCKLSNIKHTTIKSKDNYSFSLENIINKYLIEKPKILLICNPNNPTGSYIKKSDIIKILEKVEDTIVIMDEAYIEFGGESTVDLINEYENLIIMRTLSKAFGLAGLRIGALISNESMVENLWKVKLPYNLNSASQLLANQAFQNIEIINKERSRLIKKLEDMDFKVYPSMTNFIMIESNIKDLASKLENKKVLIRDFNKDIKNHYRITVGSREDNNYLIKILKEVKNESR